MMYQGPADGSGTWTTINVPDTIAGGTVANTVPHSTMGDLVVGNYDLAGAPLSCGNAFVFDARSGQYRALSIGKLTCWDSSVFVGPTASSRTLPSAPGTQEL